MMETTGETQETAGAASADAAVGPPPRLPKWPIKIEQLPAHYLSSEQREKVRLLRRFFDSLSIADEEFAATNAAAGPSGMAAAAHDISCRESVHRANFCSIPAAQKHCATLTQSTHAAQGGDSVARAAVVVDGCAGEICSAAETGAHNGSCGADSAATSPVSSWWLWNHSGRRESPAASTGSASGRYEADAEKPGMKSCSVTVAPSRASSRMKTPGALQEVAAEQHQQGSEQEQQRAHQRQSVASEKRQNDESKVLHWDEVLWLEDDMILARYLRSYGWSIQEAQRQLLRTLRWRRQQKPQYISPNQVATFAKSGSVYRKGFDIHGRGVIYFKPGRHSTTSSNLFQRYVVYTIERALQSVDRERGVDQLVFIMDFSEWGLWQIPQSQISRELVSVLNDHYTDVLATAFIVNAPSYFDPIWRLVSLMVHPDTAKKVLFVHNTKERSGGTQNTRVDGKNSKGGCSNSNDARGYSSNSSVEETSLDVLRKLIPSPFLEQCVGGDSPLDYDHDRYWQTEKEQFLQVSIHCRQQRPTLQEAVRTRRKLQKQQQCCTGDSAATASFAESGVISVLSSAAPSTRQ